MITIRRWFRQGFFVAQMFGSTLFAQSGDGWLRLGQGGQSQVISVHLPRLAWANDTTVEAWVRYEHWEVRPDGTKTGRAARHFVNQLIDCKHLRVEEVEHIYVQPDSTVYQDTVVAQKNRRWMTQAPGTFGESVVQAICAVAPKHKG